MVAAIGVGLASALGLYMLYSSAEHHWPDNYFSVGPSVDPIVSRRLGRYALFRLGPIYLAAVFTAVTVHRLHQTLWPGLVALTVTHLGSTSLRAIWRLLRRSDRRSFYTPLAFHLFVCVAVIVLTASSLLTYSLLQQLIPRPSDIASALWTGLFAAVLAVWVQRLTFRPTELPLLVANVKREVGLDLLAYTRSRCLQAKCEPALLESILLTEALNRPSWMRSLEYKKGRLLKSGSYGVMQVQAKQPLTDRESIDRSVTRFAGAEVPRNDRGEVLLPAFQALIEKHNRDRNFIDLVVAIYQLTQPRWGRATSAKAIDRMPIIIVDDIKRSGEVLKIAGRAVATANQLDFNYYANEHWSTWATADVQDLDEAGRGTFHIIVPVAASQMIVQESQMGGDSDSEARRLTVDCSYVD